MSAESWLFLFAAIPAVGTLLAFFRIDVITISGLFRKPMVTGGPRIYSGRDIIIVVCVLASFGFSGAGFLLSKEKEPHLSDSQKRTLLKSAAPMRTFMSSIVISITNGDPDTEPLAHDIAAIFNRVGIEPIQVFTRPDNSNQVGIIICIKDLNKPPPGTEELKNALQKSGIEFNVGPFPVRGFAHAVADQNQLAIWVAPAHL